MQVFFKAMNFCALKMLKMWVYNTPKIFQRIQENRHIFLKLFEEKKYIIVNQQTP